MTGLPGCSPLVNHTNVTTDRQPREIMNPRTIRLGMIKLFMVGQEAVDIKFLTQPKKYIFDPQDPRAPSFVTS